MQSPKDMKKYRFGEIKLVKVYFKKMHLKHNLSLDTCAFGPAEPNYTGHTD